MRWLLGYRCIGINLLRCLGWLRWLLYELFRKRRIRVHWFRHDCDILYWLGNFCSIGINLLRWIPCLFWLGWLDRLHCLCWRNRFGLRFYLCVLLLRLLRQRHVGVIRLSHSFLLNRLLFRRNIPVNRLRCYSLTSGSYGRFLHVTYCSLLTRCKWYRGHSLVCCRQHFLSMSSSLFSETFLVSLFVPHLAKIFWYYVKETTKQNKIHKMLHDVETSPLERYTRFVHFFCRKIQGLSRTTFLNFNLLLLTQVPNKL